MVIALIFNDNDDDLQDSPWEDRWWRKEKKKNATYALEPHLVLRGLVWSGLVNVKLKAKHLKSSLSSTSDWCTTWIKDKLTCTLIRVVLLRLWHRLLFWEAQITMSSHEMYNCTLIRVIPDRVQSQIKQWINPVLYEGRWSILDH